MRHRRAVLTMAVKYLVLGDIQRQCGQLENLMTQGGCGMSNDLAATFRTARCGLADNHLVRRLKSAQWPSMSGVSRFSANRMSVTRRCNFFRSAFTAGESVEGDFEELRED